MAEDLAGDVDEQAGDALVAVAAEGARQGDHGRRERVLVVAQLRLAALGEALLAEGTAGTALGYAEPLTDRRDALAAA